MNIVKTIVFGLGLIGITVPQVYSLNTDILPQEYRFAAVGMVMVPGVLFACYNYWKSRQQTNVSNLGAEKKAEIKQLLQDDIEFKYGIMFKNKDIIGQELKKLPKDLIEQAQSQLDTMYLCLCRYRLNDTLRTTADNDRLFENVQQAVSKFCTLLKLKPIQLKPIARKDIYSTKTKKMDDVD